MQEGVLRGVWPASVGLTHVILGLGLSVQQLCRSRADLYVSNVLQKGRRPPSQGLSVLRSDATAVFFVLDIRFQSPHAQEEFHIKI